MADLVIAADGLHSIAVETILGQPNPPQLQELYDGCLRFLIPTEYIEADPAARWWNENSDGQLRVYTNGTAGTRLVSYPCRKYSSPGPVGGCQKRRPALC